MNVLGISGSPRSNGNSEILLNEALQSFIEKGWETTILKMSALSVHPCTACNSCLTAGKCVVNDDMEKFYAAFAKCQAIIIASPVYYRNITSKLAAVFERHYGCKSTRPLVGKPGGAIVIGRGSGGGQSIVLSIIHNWLLSCGAICVPGELNGVSAAADKAGDILQQPERLKQSRILGENVLITAEKVSSNRE
jgi:multimeric flavodoxin WrbA